MGAADLGPLAHAGSPAAQAPQGCSGAGLHGEERGLAPKQRGYGVGGAVWPVGLRE